MDDAELIIFACLLAPSKALKVLRLSGDQFGEPGLRALAEALGTNVGLQQLELSGRALHFEGVSLVAEQVVKHPALEEVCLNVPVPLKALRENAVENILWALSTLGDRGDRRKGVMDADVVLLAHALVNNKSVKSIDLTSNYVTDAGVKPLAQALETTNVASINLSKNRVGDEGAQALARAITHGRLTSVDLSSYNFVTDVGAMALAAAVSGKAAQERISVKLSLASNNIGEEGAVALAEAANACESAKVNLAYNNLTERARNSLRAAGSKQGINIDF